VIAYDISKNKSSAVAEMGDRSVTIKMDWKVGLLYPFPWEGELGPHLTQCGLGEAYLHTSFILIYPTVWPQYTNVTDRTDRTTVRQHRANRFTNGRQNPPFGVRCM